MKITVYAMVALGFLLTACKNNPPKNTTIGLAKDSTAVQPDFFPVPDYIGGELKMIDSLKLPLALAVTVNGKTNSGVITYKDMLVWAKKFQEPNIGHPDLKKQYTETSIADQSIPSVTLIYTAANNQLPVQKINVFIKPDPEQNDKVTGVYIEKSFADRDTFFYQKLYWKTGRNMQVITEKKINGKVLPAEQVKITWNFAD